MPSWYCSIPLDHQFDFFQNSTVQMVVIRWFWLGPATGGGRRHRVNTLRHPSLLCCSFTSHCCVVSFPWG